MKAILTRQKNANASCIEFACKTKLIKIEEIFSAQQMQHYRLNYVFSDCWID